MRFAALFALNGTNPSTPTVPTVSTQSGSMSANATTSTVPPLPNQSGLSSALPVTSMTDAQIAKLVIGLQLICASGKKENSNDFVHINHSVLARREGIYFRGVIVGVSRCTPKKNESHCSVN